MGYMLGLYDRNNGKNMDTTSVLKGDRIYGLHKGYVGIMEKNTETTV